MGKAATPKIKPPEVIEIETRDGIRLRADVHEPPWRTKKIGTLVLSHALGRTRADFEKAHFSSDLAKLGWRTVAFDFRGHGESAATAFRYDDLVMEDLPSVVATARSRNRPADGPVIVIGQSLGGHAALASQAIGKLGADAIVAISAAPWIRELEPSNVRWMVKRTAMRVANEVMDRAGSIGQDAAAYLGQISKSARDGRWTSEDGAHDYLAAISTLAIPVLGIALKDDRLACPPDCAAALTARCGAKATLQIALTQKEVNATIAAWLVSTRDVPGSEKSSPGS